MPEFVKRRVWSPAGTRLALGTAVWPRSSKNSTKRFRISAAGSGVIRGSCSGTRVDIGRNGTERAPRSRARGRSGGPLARSVTPRPNRRTNGPSDILRRLFGHSTTEPRTDAKRRGLARRLGSVRRDRRPVPGSLREPALPDRRAGDRRADERTQRETPGERRCPLVSLLLGTAGDGPDQGLDHRRHPDGLGHGPTLERRVGPRTDTIDTAPMPTHATSEAPTVWKSPIRSRSRPSRAPMASPAHAPRKAARSSSGSWPPAEPRM